MFLNYLKLVIKNLLKNLHDQAKYVLFVVKDLENLKVKNIVLKNVEIKQKEEINTLLKKRLITNIAN